MTSHDPIAVVGHWMRHGPGRGDRRHRGSGRRGTVDGRDPLRGAGHLARFATWERRRRPLPRSAPGGPARSPGPVAGRGRLRRRQSRPSGSTSAGAGLPGEHLPRPARAAGPEIGPRRPAQPARGRQPGAARRGSAAAGSGVHIATASPSCSCAATGSTSDVAPDQGHGRARLRTSCQGRGGERHDRRPGPQRPGPGVHARARSPCRGCWRWRRTRAWCTSSRPWPATCARARRGHRSSAATFPPGSVTGAPKLAALDIIRARSRPARSLLRGVRLGGCRRRHRRARRGDPHVLA